MTTIYGSASSSSEDLLERCVEAEADRRYRFDSEVRNGRYGQRKSSGLCEERCLFAEMEGSMLVRKKKRHRSLKPHRAARSNDCRFAPRPKSGSGPYFMNARNFARIGRNGLKFQKRSDRVSLVRLDCDAYYLSESNLNQYGFEDADLAQLIIALQNGADVTPEDYDHLLKLDELTRPNDAACSSRRHAAEQPLAASMDCLSLDGDESEGSAGSPSADGGTDSSLTAGDTCAICMDLCEEHSGVKTLLCGHTFHAECLRDWWLNAPSMTCPLDNVDVRDMRPAMEGRITEPSDVPLRCFCI